MNLPLDELYLSWLYNFVSDPELTRPSLTFWKLTKQMYTKEFVWFVPNDDNRIEDGRYLRDEFIEDLGLEDVDPDWLYLGCSMLEMLIGLSRRLSFIDEGEPSEWFWRLINNLGLRYSDRNKFPMAHVEEVLDNVIWRTYDPNGFGGLFPLSHADRDQRDVEIWYQMSSYLLERA